MDHVRQGFDAAVEAAVATVGEQPGEDVIAQSQEVAASAAVDFVDEFGVEYPVALAVADAIVKGAVAERMVELWQEQKDKQTT